MEGGGRGFGSLWMRIPRFKLPNFSWPLFSGKLWKMVFFPPEEVKGGGTRIVAYTQGKMCGIWVHNEAMLLLQLPPPSSQPSVARGSIHIRAEPSARVGTFPMHDFVFREKSGLTNNRRTAYTPLLAPWSLAKSLKPLQKKKPLKSNICRKEDVITYATENCFCLLKQSMNYKKNKSKLLYIKNLFKTLYKFSHMRKTPPVIKIRSF